MSLSPAVSPGAYLARLATARPLYVLLFREAVGVLAPAADTCRNDQLVCGLPLRELAKRLDVSPSIVSEEMRRLVNHGWVSGGRKRSLGFRTGRALHLLADVAAQEATGEVGLVSRVVLDHRPHRDAERPAQGRGLARRFEL